jgi:hypothetical protein
MYYQSSTGGHPTHTREIKEHFQEIPVQERILGKFQTTHLSGSILVIHSQVS